MFCDLLSLCCYVLCQCLFIVFVVKAVNIFCVLCHSSFKKMFRTFFVTRLILIWAVPSKLLHQPKLSIKLKPYNWVLPNLFKLVMFKTKGWYSPSYTFTVFSTSRVFHGRRVNQSNKCKFSDSFANFKPVYHNCVGHS